MENEGLIAKNPLTLKNFEKVINKLDAEEGESPYDGLQEFSDWFVERYENPELLDGK